MTKQHPSDTTRWSAVAALVAAGMVSAFQVGKAAIAVPLLQDDLGISLVFASWIVGAFGALGAAFGLFAGSIVSTFEPRRSLIDRARASSESPALPARWRPMARSCSSRA